MKNRSLPTRLKAYVWFNKLLKLTLGFYLKRRFHLRAVSRRALFKTRPPYLLLPNHVGYWDPFMVGLFVPQPVHFVAADAVFRSPVMRRLLSLVGAVPKTKGVSDLEMLRQLLRIRDAGGVMSLFAEGGRSWDGTTLPLMAGTAKLVKFLRIAVICPKFRGGYLAHPRWSRSPRSGPLYIDYIPVLSAEEVRRLSLQEIEDRLIRALAHDEHAWREAAAVSYRARRPAEYAEHVLFLCPACESLATIHSHRKTLRCNACGFTARLDANGRISCAAATSGAAHSPGSAANREFRCLRDWHQWELRQIDTIVERYLRKAAAAASSGARRPLIRESGIVCRRGFRTNRLHEHGTGVLQLDADELRFTPGAVESNATAAAAEEEALRLPLAALRGVNIQLQRELELYVGDTLYTFTPLSARVSMYKWERLMSALIRLGAAG